MALVFPMVKFRDTVRVTQPWEEGPRSPAALRGLQLSKSRPSAVTRCRSPGLNGWHGQTLGNVQ